MRVLLLVLMLVSSFQSAISADVEATLSPSTATFGDTLRLEIRASGVGSRSVLFPVPGDTAFTLIRVDSSRVAQGEIGYTVAVYDTGRHDLSPMPVIVGHGGAAETLWTSPLTVVIRSGLPDTAQAIQPIKPYRAHPFRLRDVIEWLWIPAVAALGVLGWWLWRRYRRKANGEIIPEKPLPPPHEEAVRDLIALRDKKYPMRGMLKEFYIEFSHIMRRYLERRYGFQALEMTTYDLELELEDRRYDRALRDRLLPALRESDLVKFAKHVPDPNLCSSYIETGFELIEMTRERPQPDAVEKAA